MESTSDEPGSKKPRLGSVIIKQSSVNESRGGSDTDSTIFAEEVSSSPKLHSKSISNYFLTLEIQIC